MSLAPGSRVGSYEISGILGEGGMGVVFRARDTRLQRDVALKLLPSHFAGDVERLKRFEREAQILAALNHPNIAHVYGLEVIADAGSATPHAIAMELVEGETLADHLQARGPLPVDDTLRIARQLIAALQAAHERGIVHRDLKPANIRLTPERTVKVLDFGLAKDIGPSVSPSLSHSPTVTNQSMPGVILGTLAYMSPEQARGKAVDARADIWAFGCVLFEMLTGRQAFEGETATDIIAKIISGAPEWGRLPANTPGTLRQLLHVALTKDPRERLQHIGDSRLLLDPHAVDTPSDEYSGSRVGKTIAVGIGAAAVGFIAALALAFVYLRPKPVEAPEIRFEMQAPGFAAVAPVGGGTLTISPDGRQIAYVASPDGTPRIYVSPIGRTTARPLQGTERAAGLFWSPDSRFLAFTADASLKKVEVAGGPVQTLVTGQTLAVPGTWTRDGSILFSRTSSGAFGALARISAGGGEPAALTINDSSKQPIAARVRPMASPDGRSIVHFDVAGVGNPGTLAGRLFATALDSGDTAAVRGYDESPMRAAHFSWLAPGYLLYLKPSGTLVAQQFDQARAALTGEPYPIADNVGTFAASDTGVIVYSTTSATNDLPVQGLRRLIWFDRKGKILGEVGKPASYTNPKLSPDGHRIVVQGTESGNFDIWIVDAERGAPSRLTFDPAADGVPMWSYDGQRVLFASSRGSQLPFPNSLFERSATGAGEDRPVLKASSSELFVPADWTSDGRFILYSRTDLARATTSTNEVWMLPLFGDRKPTLLLKSESGTIGFAHVSSDMHWLVYQSSESGTSEILVRPFPDVNAGIWQVPGMGGRQPFWRRDGREIFYLSRDFTVMAVPVTTKEGQIRFEEPVPLFKSGLTTYPTNPPEVLYAVSPDGQRFLINVPDEAGAARTTPASAPASINVILNWMSALPKQ